jgi:hypothetical protein
MPAIDPDALAGQIASAMNQTAKADLTQLEGFSAEQLHDIAEQAATIAAGSLDGSITGTTRTYLLQSLAELTRSFVNTLAGLAVISAEEVWNAAVGVIWGAINKATGLALTAP